MVPWVCSSGGCYTKACPEPFDIINCRYSPRNSIVSAVITCDYASLCTDLNWKWLIGFMVSLLHFYCNSTSKRLGHETVQMISISLFRPFYKNRQLPEQDLSGVDTWTIPCGNLERSASDLGIIVHCENLFTSKYLQSWKIFYSVRFAVAEGILPIVKILSPFFYQKWGWFTLGPPDAYYFVFYSV